MLGLKINFDKSKSILIGVRDGRKRIIENMLTCKMGEFPIKYLGLPISDIPLKVSDRDFLPEKVGHRLTLGRDAF
jgi:hypothetical protein